MTQDSNNSLNTLRSAHEEEYFQRKNREALERIARIQDRTRLSPVAGIPMTQETIMGVVVDRCPQSGGIWLDQGELEELVKAYQELHTSPEQSSNLLSGFISALTSFNK